MTSHLSHMCTSCEKIMRYVCGVFFKKKYYYETAHFICNVSKKSSHCAAVWSVVCVWMPHDVLWKLTLFVISEY